jgi:hypothetical protein
MIFIMTPASLVLVLLAELVLVVASLAVLFCDDSHSFSEADLAAIGTRLRCNDFAQQLSASAFTCY